MEQETLEEAAEKRIPTSTKVWDLIETRRSDFKAGAKWQAKRMYSEEEVLEILREFYKVASLKDFPLVTTIPLWFEQFKKK